MSPGQAFIAATHARDLDAMVELTSDDVILKSPIMGGAFVLEGRGEVAQAFRILIEGFEDLAFGELLSGGDSEVVIFTGRAKGEPFEAAQHMRVDATGKIDHIILYVRPFVGLAAFTRVVGPGFMRPHNRVWAAFAAVYGWFVGLAIRSLVWMGAPMVKRSVRRIAARKSGD